MSIKVEIDGEEKEVFTPEEVAAKDAEIEAARAEVVAAKADVEKYQRVSAEKTENFKKLNDMTEAERATFTAKEIENMKRVEAAETKAKDLEDRYNTDTQNRIKTDTESALAKFHGGDEKLKEALEKNFKMIGLEGNDTATIQERARLAAAMEAGKTGRQNPLMAPMNGGAPRVQQKTKTEEFLKSDKAIAALKMMGEK